MQSELGPETDVIGFAPRSAAANAAQRCFPTGGALPEVQGAPCAAGAGPELALFFEPSCFADVAKVLQVGHRLAVMWSAIAIELGDAGAWEVRAGAAMDKGPLLRALANRASAGCVASPATRA
jgi:hypothetical protein